jgi:hypothetical protein
MWPVPLSGSRWESTYEGGAVTAEQQAHADYRVGTAGYFGTLGVALLEGRLHRADDRRETVVISRHVAEHMWPGQTALGRTLRADPYGGGAKEFEVIGVVEDVRYTALREAPAGALYFDVRGWSWTDWEFDVVVRTAGDPLALVPRVRDVLAEMDPEIPVAQPMELSALLARQTAQARFALSLVALFSAVAGALALIGLYGVISQTVVARTKEIGLRMALGSPRSSVTRMVLEDALRTAGTGLALGLVGALLLSRFLRALLFGVEPSDPAVYAVGCSLLGALALVAGWLPARRAAATDPAAVLNAD